MAELTPFGFAAGRSLLHRIDARSKILFLILLSVAGFNVNFWGLGILSAILGGVLYHIRLPLKAGFKELRFLFILLFFVFIARTLSTGGQPELNLKLLTVSVPGLTQGALVCWRLALIVLLGFAFIATTRPSEIKAAVQWFLKPVPFVSEKKAAAMMGLIMRFVPVIFDQARETMQAQKARGIENRKNPVYRLAKLGLPLIRRTFESADNLVSALEARCFSESRTDPELVFRRRDWISLAAVAILCVTILNYFTY